MLYRVCDLETESILDTQYDLAFFSSGYENRCTYLPRLLNPELIQEHVILGFQEKADHEQRKANDTYFTTYWPDGQISISAEDDGPIYDVLDSYSRSSRRKGHILIDYSSMSRLWYAGILNWARFIELSNDIYIDFVYSVGEHRQRESAMVIHDISCIPGCEGGASSRFSSTAVFGLGFEGLAALCVLDRLEPDVVYAYLASPAAFDDYPERARIENKELINEHAKAIFELPLTSVEGTFRYLAELIAPHRSGGDISIIPMGPKPHVLAAILLAMRFDEVACIRVSGKGATAEPVNATGKMAATRVQFRKYQPSVSRESSDREALSKVAFHASELSSNSS